VPATGRLFKDGAPPTGSGGRTVTYSKAVVAADATGLRQKLNNWAALTDVNILETQVQERNLRLKGKKVYRGREKFRISLLFLWIIIGVAVSMLLSYNRQPGAGAFFLVIFPIGYFVYYLVRNRKHTVEFEIASTDSTGSVTLKVTASEDLDEVKADVNALVTTVM